MSSVQAAMTPDSTRVSLDFLRRITFRRPLITGNRAPTCSGKGTGAAEFAWRLQGSMLAVHSPPAVWGAGAAMFSHSENALACSA